MAAADSSELLHDFSPLFKQYKDGRVVRMVVADYSPPSLDQETNVRSKDVVISPEIGLSARLYVPKNPTAGGGKLPLLIYYHGGGFVIESAFSNQYQTHLNNLVSKAQVVALSVNYRLAPEHPLPAAYEDSWEALKWVASQSEKEDWIRDTADLGRVYLGGDSAGGNIAHNVAMRFGSEKIDGINLIGMFLNCPYFTGEEAIGREEEHHPFFPKSYSDKLWRYVCPETPGCDDPRINPGEDAKLAALGCKKVLVYVAGKDPLRLRGWYYKEVLERSGWNGEVEVVEVEDEDHVFSVLFPTTESSSAFFDKVSSLLT